LGVLARWLLPPQADAKQELSKAKATLTELRSYVKLDDIAAAVDALSAAQSALEATPKDSPDYSAKLAALQKEIDNSKQVLNSSLKRQINLANDKKATDLLSRLDWNYPGFEKCFGYVEDYLEKGSPTAPPALRDDAERCRDKFTQTRKNLDKYIADQDSELVAQDNQLADLKKQYRETQDAEAKKKIEQAIEKLNKEREQTKQNKKTAEKVKRSLTLGEALLAIAEIIGGIVTLISCETAVGCVAGVAMISHGYDQLTSEKSEVKSGEPDPGTSATQSDGPPTPQEAALREAAAKPPADAAKIEKYAKDNPALDVIPTDSFGPFILAQKTANGAVSELTIIVADTGATLATIKDDGLLVDEKNGTLAMLTGFKKFSGGFNQLSDDKSMDIIELRGFRTDGNPAAF